MNSKSLLSKKLLGTIGQFLVISLVFGISYTQEPLYADNQNTKFLHGLASAGLGYLKEDWLANTIDPLPAFTFLVSITYSYLHENIFYFYYIIIFGVYLYSILGIVSIIFKINSNNIKYLTCIALIIAVHCVHIHIKSLDLDTGLDLHYGLAEQYILGPYFQPSNFGVFIIFSIYAFLQRNYFLAVVGLALAATFHPAYLVSAGVLNLSYMIITYKNKGDLKRVLYIGVLAFLSLLPVFSYMYFTFRPTSPELWEKAQDIIVNFRIPHHSIPKVFLSKTSAYVQIFLMIFALYLIRRTRVFPVIFIPFLITASLTIIQLFYSNNTIAFIAPWRMSAFLVPISTCIVIAWLVSYLFDKYYQQIIKNKKAIVRVGVAIISIIFIVGSYNQVQMLLKQDDSIPMMNFVKETSQAGETYLVPNDTKKLRKFRLYTGAPIFINLKSHPYKDVEVLEWYKRNLIAESFYKSPVDNKCDILDKLSVEYRVNKVVIDSKNFNTSCEFLEQLYRDKHYGVYRINS